MNDPEKDILENPLLRKTDAKTWYHSIEISPGVFTPGQDHSNIAPTREILKRCEIEGTNCLGIGTMDGLISILLERRGAASVTAYDRIDRSDQINYVKMALGSKLNYINRIKLNELSATTSHLGLSPFDVVVFSGVLYHMFDPLTGLAAARGLVRNGGLFIIETSTVYTDNDEVTLHFNSEGRFYPGTNYWQISLRCLDNLLRFVHLLPLDIRYLKGKKIDETKRIDRVCVVCQAIEAALPLGNDTWISKKIFNTYDFQEILDWNSLIVENSKVLKYDLKDQERILHKESEALDIYNSIQLTPPMKITNRAEQVRLQLDAIY